MQAPFYPASGLMSIRRSGIVSTERFELAGPTTTLKVPIVDGYVPNVSVQVDLVGKSARLDDDGNATKDLPDRVAYAMGSIDLPVPPKQRTLAVTIAPREDKVAPGAKTQLDVTVKDANGKAVSGAEVAVIAVDESILALTGWQFSSPIDVFYGGRYSGGQDYRYRQWVKLSRPDAASLSATGDMMEASVDGRSYEGDMGGDYARARGRGLGVRRGCKMGSKTEPPRDGSTR